MRLFILTFLIYTIPLIGKPSDFIIKGGVFLNGNIYSSSFSQLPGIKNCCNEFSDAFGIAPGIGFGGEYILGNGWFGFPVNYGFTIEYSDISANYSVEEFRGNELGLNDWEEIRTEHKLEPSISLLNTKHYLALYPFGRDLSLTAGFSIGFPLSGEFKQGEYIIRPEGLKFGDGSEVNNPASGDIPDINPMQIVLNFNMRYNLYQFANFTVLPEISYKYAINNVVKSIDWKAHGIAAGINLMYRFPDPVPPKPIPAPTPELPPPSKPEFIPPAINLALNVSYKGKKLENNSMIEITEQQEINIEKHTVFPVFFFGKDSHEPIERLDLNGTMTNSSLTLYRSIVDNANRNNISSLKIDSWVAGDEPESLARERAEIVVNKLREYGLNNNININYSYPKMPAEIAYPELIDEFRKVTVTASNDYFFTEKTKIISDTDEGELIIDYLITGDSKSPVFSGKIYLNDELYLDFNDTQTIKPLELLSKVTSNLKIVAEARNEYDSTDKETITLSMTKNIIRDTTVNDIQKNDTETYLLALSIFDRSEFYFVNDFAGERLENIKDDVKKIEILPFTDNLGEGEYNKRLSEKRARNAMKLLPSGIPTEIIYTDSFHSNDTPYGRMLNRSVYIRIIK